MTNPKKKRKVGQGMKPRVVPAANEPPVSANEGQEVVVKEAETGGKVGIETSDTLEAEKLQNLESTGDAETPLCVAQVEPEVVPKTLEELMRDSVGAGSPAIDLREEAPVCGRCGKPWGWNPTVDAFEHDDNCLGLRPATAKDLERLKEANPLLTVTRPSIAEIEAAMGRNQRIELMPNGEVEMGLALGVQADGTFVIAVRVREGIIEPLRQQAEADRKTPEEWLSERCGEYLDQWWSPAASR